MGAGSDFLREQLVFVLDVVRRRWLLFFVPVALAALLSGIAVKLAPMKYSANSLILLQAANRNVGGNSPYANSSTMEQVQAIGAWLKSDQVLSELVPQMSGYTEPKSPGERLAQMKALGASLSFELAGNSVLQVKLEGRRREGLGRDLEIILSRLMEGLTGPEQNVFSAPQFVHMRRNEDVANAEAALKRAIEDGGFQDPLQIRNSLHQLWTMQPGSGSGESHGADAGSEEGDAGPEPDAAEQARRSISNDPEEVDRLARLYAAYQETLARQSTLQLQAGPVRSNYVSIFNSPDDLLIIGRPKDPIVGENAARKLAIGGVLLGVLGGCGLVLIAELFHGVLRTRREYEMASGLPVVARMTRIPQP